MPRPDNEILLSAYMADLEGEISDTEYGQKCAAELAELQYAIDHGITIGFDRYGIPSVKAGVAAQIEALKLIRACLK